MRYGFENLTFAVGGWASLPLAPNTPWLNVQCRMLGGSTVGFKH